MPVPQLLAIRHIRVLLSRSDRGTARARILVFAPDEALVTPLMAKDKCGLPDDPPGDHEEAPHRRPDGPFRRSGVRQSGLYSPLTVWSAVVAYSLQIYCDFSGYSDM